MSDEMKRLLCLVTWHYPYLSLVACFTYTAEALIPQIIWSRW